MWILVIFVDAISFNKGIHVIYSLRKKIILQYFWHISFITKVNISSLPELHDIQYATLED